MDRREFSRRLLQTAVREGGASVRRRLQSAEVRLLASLVMLLSRCYRMQSVEKRTGHAACMQVTAIS